MSSVYNFRSDHGDGGGPSSHRGAHSGHLGAGVHPGGVNTSNIIDAYEKLEEHIDKWAL